MANSESVVRQLERRVGEIDARVTAEGGKREAVETELERLKWYLK